MKKDAVKLKKGGLDTIIAYIVVMLPLLYVLIYMVATIYHFSVQTYLNQVVKEAVVMASTFGEITSGGENTHEGYIQRKLKDVFDEDDDGNYCEIKYYVKEYDDDEGVVSSELKEYTPNSGGLNKGDLIGIQVKSVMPSMLGNVANFSFFGSGAGVSLKYTSYREEIVRNERKN